MCIFPSNFPKLYANSRLTHWLRGLFNSGSNGNYKAVVLMEGNSTLRCFQNFWCPVVTMLWWQYTAGIWGGEGPGVPNVLHKEQEPGVPCDTDMSTGQRWNSHVHKHIGFFSPMVLTFTEFFQKCNYCMESNYCTVLNSAQNFSKSYSKFQGTELDNRTFFYQFAFVAVTFMVMLCINKNMWVFDCCPVVVSKHVHIKIYIVYIYM